jgi:DNA-binding NarL/FixJ family response regulator
MPRELLGSFECQEGLMQKQEDAAAELKFEERPRQVLSHLGCGHANHPIEDRGATSP